MKMWIDQAECIGNGICAEVAPTAIVMVDGIAYARDGERIMASRFGNPEGLHGMVSIDADAASNVIEAAEECPAECIYVEL